MGLRYEATFRFRDHARRVVPHADPERAKEYFRQYRLRHLERKRAADREYQAAHRDRLKTYLAAYYLRNKEKAQAENKIWRAVNAEKIRAANRAKRKGPEGDAIRARRRQHYAENKARYVANARRRERHIKRATPPWADLEAIAAFYVERERISAKTGVLHHVDHQIPLRGKWVWGLHVDYNLRIIPAVENLSKSNFVTEAA